MEYWVTRGSDHLKNLHPFYPIIPPFHHSNIPLFFPEDGLAGMVLGCSPPVSNVEEV
jgi:hypothetical protein